jgi:hypothetical protein
MLIELFIITPDYYIKYNTIKHIGFEIFIILAHLRFMSPEYSEDKAESWESNDQSIYSHLPWQTEER